MLRQCCNTEKLTILKVEKLTTLKISLINILILKFNNKLSIKTMFEKKFVSKINLYIKEENINE